MTVLRTERLVLRPFTEDDLDELVGLDSDPEVVRYAQPELLDRPPTRESYRAVLAEIMAAETFWAAEEDGAFVGWFFLRGGELGYRLKRSAWGRGLATEGARAVLATTSEPVWAEVDDPNTRSRRVVEKLGFVPVGSERYERR